VRVVDFGLSVIFVYNTLVRLLRAAKVLLPLCLLLTGSIVFAADDFVLRDIRVEGLQRISEGTLFNYLPVNLGDEITPLRVQESMRAIFDTGFFRDVQMYREGDTLVIVVVERPSIESFSIEGNKDIKTEDLEEPLAKIGLKTGRIFDQSVLDEVEQSLLDQYYSGGKYAAQVESIVNDLPGNKVDIQITIKEGKRAKIRQINIVGNTVYSDKQILDMLALRTPHLLSFIRKDDLYSREALSGDLETIRSLYMDSGYADFDIDSTQVAVSPDKKSVFITVNVNEGQLFTISSVRLAGDLILSEEVLRAYLQVVPEQIYSQRSISQSVDLLKLALGNEGYAFAEVQPVPELDPVDKTVALTFYLDPKNRVYVRSINFDGADSVDDQVFRREMRQFEGAYLNNARVERSRVRVQRLPYVEEVSFQTNPVLGTTDQVDVDFTIKEGLPGSFGGGIGYSDSQGILLNGNFVHTNFMGTGNRVSADLNYGEFRTIIGASYTNPYITPNEVSRTLSATYREITQFTADASDFDTTTLSLGVEYGYPLTEYQRVIWGGTWQKSELAVNRIGSSQQAIDWVLSNGSPTVIDSQIATTDFSTYEFLGGWVFDSRNRSLFPTRGAQHRAVLSTTIPGSEVQYWFANYTFSQYIPTLRYFILAFKFDSSYGDSFGKTTSIPPYRNRFAGGPNTVRGYRENGLGPVDSLGNPYGGNILTVLQNELILPLPQSLSRKARAALFFDIGNVFSNGNVNFDAPDGNPTSYAPGDSDLKYSTGVSVEWLSPLGLFKFSYALPLNAQDFSATTFGDNTERFQFTIGGAF
jgi:outer membrane protein insertion porin family